MVNTTVKEPIEGSETLIGKSVKSIINRLDQINFLSILKKVFADHTHEFLAYSVGRHSFISLMARYNDEVAIMFEMPSGPPEDREEQKRTLMKSARGFLARQPEPEPELETV